MSVRFFNIIPGGEVVAEEDEGEEDGEEARPSAPPTLACFLTAWFHAQ